MGKVLSIDDFTDKLPEKNKKIHVSGSLNNLVPAVIHEMKGNLTKAEDYIDFLKDNEIIDF